MECSGIGGGGGAADARRPRKRRSTARERAQAARVAREHEEARKGQEDELSKLRAELATVQARRERARATFAAELTAKEEAAKAKQELAAELELERLDEVEREAKQ